MTPVMREFILAKDILCRENSARVSYAWLRQYVQQRITSDDETYSRIWSVIEWELSILPLSASSESAAEDLYALSQERVINGTFRE
jgi:hypothetical protein